jgi:flagellar hook-length control protein FliK
MMLSINLLNAELSTFQGELPAAPALPADVTKPAGGFAELLGLRAMYPEQELPPATVASLLAIDGKTLPDTGNTLPLPELPETAGDLDADASAADVLPLPIPGPLPPTPAATAAAAAANTTESTGLPLPELPETAGDLDADASAADVLPLPIPGPLPPTPAATAAAASANTTESTGLPLPANLVAQRNVAAQEGQRAGGATSNPVTSGSSLAAAEIQLQVASSGVPELNRAWQPAATSVLPATAKNGEIVLPLDGEGEIEMPRRDIHRNLARGERQAAQRDESVRQPFDYLKASMNIEQRTGSVAAAQPSTSGSEALARTLPAAAVASAGTEAAPVPAAANAAQASASPPTAAASVPRIDIPLQDPAWADALNDRVTFIAGKDMRNAEIRLHPAELGPIRVQVSVDDRGTHVSFVAHHAATRDAIEQAMPRLRDLFADQGLSLGQTSVSEQGVKQDRGGQGAERNALQIPDIESDDAVEPLVSGKAVRSGSGLVDTFV